MQKEFLKSCEGFLRAALSGHGHPGPSWKIAKMALFNPCMEFEIFLGQVTSFDFIQNRSQVSSIFVYLATVALKTISKQNYSQGIFD